MDHDGSVNFGEIVVKELCGLLLIQGVIRQCCCSEGVVGSGVLKVRLGAVGDFYSCVDVMGSLSGIMSLCCNVYA